MVLIEAQEPQTVELGMSFYLAFILVLPYFRFRSVLPKLKASSGLKGEAVRATQHQQNWRYIAATANIIGTAWHLALIGEAGECSPHLWRSGANSQRQYEVFADFCMFAALRPSAEYESQDKNSIGAAQGIERICELFPALRLLLQKSPNNFAVLTGNGNMFNTRRRRNKNSK